MGLLDNFNFDDPATMGLLSAGMNMIGNSGRGGNMNTAQIIAQGLGSGMQGMQGVQQARQLAAQLKQKQEHDALVMDSLRMENQQKQQSIAEQQKVRDFYSNFNKQGQDNLGQVSQAMGGNMSPTVSNLDNLHQAQAQVGAQQNDPYSTRMLLASALRKSGLTDAQKMAEGEEASALKFRPEFDQTPRVGVGADNKPFTYVMDKQGNKKVIEGVLPRDEMKLANLGGKDVAYNPFALTSGQEFTRTQSPDSIVSNATTIRGQNMTNQRAIDANAIEKVGKVSTTSTSLRKEFDDLPEVKNYKQALPAYTSIKDAATRNTTQSDINIVYGLAKLYDPTSVVREGEYATVAKSPNIPEKLKGYAQYLSGGGRLTPEVKAEIMAEASSRMKTYEDPYLSSRANYADIATRSGAEKSLLFPSEYKTPIDKPKTESQSTQKSVLKGQVYKGYKFKGGDPADQNNWEKQ